MATVDEYVKMAEEAAINSEIEKLTGYVADASK